MSLAELRKKQANLLAELSEKAAKADQHFSGTARQDDDRYWKPKGDVNGNGTFKIRFLPACEGEDDQWIHYWKYAIKFPGPKYYYARSLTTIGKPDPVADYKNELRNSGKEDEAKKLGRSDKYISNILIIDDQANPDNNGKVFLYEYGPQVFKLIQKAMAGDEDEGEEGFNPFDPWEGRTFILKLTKKSDFPNYEDSKFQKAASVIGSDDEIDAIWRQQHSLAGEKADSHYEDYDVLKRRLYNAMGKSLDGKDLQKNGSASKDNTSRKAKEEDSGANDEPQPDAESDADIDDILAQLGD